MKILHFFWSGEAGGRENLVYQLMKEQKQDNELNIAVLLGERRGYYIPLIEALNIEVFYLPSQGKELSIKNIVYILRVLKNFDVIHLHSPNLIIIFVIILTNSKSIFTFHGKRNFTSKSIKDYLFGKFLK